MTDALWILAAIEMFVFIVSVPIAIAEGDWFPLWVLPVLTLVILLVLGCALGAASLVLILGGFGA